MLYTNSDHSCLVFTQIESSAKIDLSLGKIAMTNFPPFPYTLKLMNLRICLIHKKARLMIRQSGEYCIIEKNHLLQIGKPKQKNMAQYQRVVPYQLIQNVLKLYHDSSIGAHSDLSIIFDILKKHYFLLRLFDIIL